MSIVKFNENKDSIKFLKEGESDNDLIAISFENKPIIMRF